MEATLTTTTPGEGLYPRMRRVLRAIARCVWTWQERARERRHLADMTDQMRADVGLSAAWTSYEADKPFWQR